MALVEFQRIKHCNQKDKDIVYGYIKTVQSALPHTDNPYFIIDGLIQNMILLYFLKTMESKILTDDEQYKLFEMLQQHTNDKFKALLRTKGFNLIYSMDNETQWDRAGFIDKVYNKKNILMLIHTVENNVIGAYTSVGWDKNANENNEAYKDTKNCKKDDDAFIFGIRSRKGYEPQISYIKHSRSEYVLIHHKSWVCLFGNEYGEVILGSTVDSSGGDINAYDQNKHLTFTDDDYLFGRATCDQKIKCWEIFQIV